MGAKEFVAQGVELLFVEVESGSTRGFEFAILERGGLDAAGGDGRGKSFANGFAGVVGSFEGGQPHAHGGAKYAASHSEGKHHKNEGGEHASQRAGTILCAEIKFKDTERPEKCGEGQEGEERASKRVGIETERTSEDKKGQKQC